MPDRAFESSQLAALYNPMFRSEMRGDFTMYLPLVMRADSVLDIGCGTGALLHQARDQGHTGRLTGLDPANGMLEQARRRSDIEWVQGDLTDVSWYREFDLVVMSGHAFQVFLTDDEIRSSLATIHRVLANNGHFAFETRNPPGHDWIKQAGTTSGTVTDMNGTDVHWESQVHGPLEDELIQFSYTYYGPNFKQPETSHSTLRFLSEDRLDQLLSETGFKVVERYGDWDRSPLTEKSPEIITIATPDR